MALATRYPKATQRKGRAGADHTFQNAATATGDGTVLTLDGQQDLAVQVEADATTFTIVPEGTIDETNWHAITVTNTAGGATAETITAAGIYSADTNGLKQVRMRISAIADNTVTAIGN